MYGFRGFLGNLVTKNWQIASKFGMGIANTSFQSMYSRFLKIQKKIVFLGFSEDFGFLNILGSKTQNFEKSEIAIL